MVSVNLLSPATVLARQRARRLRRWAVVIAAVMAVAAVPVSVDVVKTARGAALERETKPVLAKLEAVRAHHQKLVAQCHDLTAQMARADALRAKRSWAALLSAVTDHAPGEVWLTSIVTTTGGGAAAPHRPARADGGAQRENASEAVTLQGPTGIRITGYALDHEWLYEFMSALKSMGVFKRVELTQAGKEPVLQGVAVRFILECTW